MPSSRIFRVSIWFFGPRFRSEMALGLPVSSFDSSVSECKSLAK
jgi:hypothetical protein